jgi:hypothetical protein
MVSLSAAARADFVETDGIPSKLHQASIGLVAFTSKPVPLEWAEASLTSQAARPDGGHYGSLFWDTGWTIGGQRFGAFNASGNGGNKIYVFTTHPLVVVLPATAYNQPYAHPQVEKLMEQLVLPALTAASAVK